VMVAVGVEVGCDEVDWTGLGDRTG
jgi:hypothetical protein